MEKNASMLLKELKANANPETAAALQRFFKTGKGDYGEGDRFLGIKVPNLRKICKNYITLPLAEIEKLLKSDYHEARFSAIVLLVKKFEAAVKNKKTQNRAPGSKLSPAQNFTQNDPEDIYNFYLAHTAQINNWDLVDLSAPQIVGGFLYPKGASAWGILYDMAKENDLWRKRISIMATFTFIRNGHYKTTMDIAEILLNDDHDLIHKAVGWMLREAANRERSVTEKFLQKHCKNMPRTMLRYAIEKFPEELRRKYLKGC